MKTKKEKLNFLQKEKVEKEYISNVKTHNKNRLEYLFNECCDQYFIIEAFIWNEATDGISWNEINDKWLLYIS